MKKSRATPPAIVLTVGHSTRTIEAFLELLRAHEVDCLVDVRTIPRSRHNPQFNEESLPAELREAGIRYKHLPGLGGLRHARANSLNKAWRNSSFRGFADYMQTPEFDENLGKLTDLAKSRRIAIMCAEAVPWRCHRSLIADALLARGFRVEHILSGVHRQQHAATPWAKIRGKRVTYPLPAAKAKPAGVRRTKRGATAAMPKRAKR